MTQARLDFSAHTTERTRDFTGRKWVFAEIDAWLADPDAPRYFIVTGEPGIGKTAIAARLTQIRDLAAIHFCIARQADTIDPLNFARSISNQLTHIDGFAQGILKDSGINLQSQQNIQENYGQAINVKIENLIVNAPSAAVAFTHTVVEPLKALYGSGFDQQLVILVDALDEAVQQRGPDTIVDLLANVRGLPSQVRFVLASRSEGAALRHFEQLDILYLVLDAGRKENLQDVQKYVRRQLAASEALRARLAQQKMQPQAFIERVTTASQDNFLYLVWLLPAVADGTQQFDALEALPKGLDGIYREFLRTRTVGGDIHRWRDHYRPLLGALAAAQEPLTAEQLVRFTGLSTQKVDDLLLDVQQFLDPPLTARGQYQLYHQSVVDFLSSKEQAQEFWIDLKAVHHSIADLYLCAWCGLDEGLPGLQEPAKRELDSGYGLRHLTVHLERANRLEDLHHLLRLERSVNQRWENVWYIAKDATGDTAGYLTDVARAWQVAEKNQLLTSNVAMHSSLLL